MHALGREKIAESFGEKLSLTAEMVRTGRMGAAHDEESKESEGQLDMSSGARTVLEIIQRMKDIEKPVTLLHLAELWKGNGRKEGWKLPAQTAPKGWQKSDCERMLVHMLLRGSPCLDAIEPLLFALKTMVLTLMS